MKGNIILMGFIVFCNPSFAQTFKKVDFSTFLKQYSGILDKQRTSNFSVNIESNLYKDIQSNELIQHNVGYILQGSELNQLSKMSTGIQLQNKEFSAAIDSTRQTVVVTKPSDLLKGRSNMEYLLGLDSTKNEFFVSSDKNYLYFRVIETTQVSSNNQLTMRFNKTGNDLTQINILYWPSNYYMDNLNDEILEQPKLVVTFSNYQNKPKANQEIEAWIDSWFDTKSAQFSLRSERSTYILKDLRITTPSK